MKRAATLEISSAGQATLPIAWRRRHGMLAGGPVTVLELDDGKGSLLLTPVKSKPPQGKGLGNLLLQMPPGMPDIPKHPLPSKDAMAR